MMNRCFILIALLIGICFVSCKKQYACQCSITYSKPGYTPYTVSSLKDIKTKTTKKRASQICAHTEKQLQANSMDYKAGDETVTTSCAVK